jgi:FMN phosphatase YigB (HAD superfamily)
VSNCDHTTRPVVERLGLPRETDEVVLSFEVRAAKPDPRIYQVALERLGVAAREAVFVDDQARYCDGAAELGIGTFLLLRDGGTPVEGVSEPGGHRVIRDLRALPGLVEGSP